jgi:hypothetical protein
VGIRHPHGALTVTEEEVHMADIIVYKNRRNELAVNLGTDVSADTFASEIREKASTTSPLIATWSVGFKTDGVDGELVLTLDDSALSAIVHKTGYMDIKRISGGEPYAVFPPVKVVFKDVVTA